MPACVLFAGLSVFGQISPDGVPAEVFGGCESAVDGGGVVAAVGEFLTQVGELVEGCGDDGVVGFHAADVTPDPCC